MFVVDTNIFIHAVHKESPHYKTARRLICAWQKEELPWHSTWSIFYEFLRVTTHRSVFASPLNSKQASDFLESIFQSPGFSLLCASDGHEVYWQKVLQENSSIRGNLWHDAHIVALMKEHGIEQIQTADTDFHRFKGIKVRNPFL